MKKILLALDCSPHSKRAAEYLADVAPHLPGSEVVLFSVVTGIPYDSRELERLVAEPAPPPEVHGDEDHQQELSQVQVFLAEIEKLFRDRGLSGNRLHCIAKPIRRGIVQDIIDVAAECGCDTIVVGRRGLSKIREMLEGSVSSDLVHKAILAVWVIE